MDSEAELKKSFIYLADQHNQKITTCKKVLLGHDSGNFRNTAYTIDTFFESTHFPKAMRMFDIGKKAMLAAASDLIAVGSIPTGALISLALPQSTPKKTAINIFKGIVHSCRHLNIGIIGGDTKKANEISIAICCFGKILTQMKTRWTANKGDIIYITGEVGKAALGLKAMLNQNLEISLRNNKKFAKQCEQAFLTPPVKKEYASLIANFATSSCDISDGFFYSLRLLTQKYGIKIEKLPIPAELEMFTIRQIIDLLNIGEDYCCLFTVSKKNEETMLAEAKKNKLAVIRIGKVLEKKSSINLMWKNKEIKINDIAGYDAFNAPFSKGL